jgi:hypothetical protein
MYKSLLIATALSLIACNKNSLQLPPPKDNIILKEKTCSFDSTHVALLQFKQNSTDKEGKVDLVVNNLTGSAITDFTLYVEMCDSIPSIQTCNNQVVIVVPQLDADKATTKSLPFKGIDLNTININAGIVSTSKKRSILSNVYEGNYVKYTNTANTFNAVGLVKGVVYADGNALFRLSLGAAANYNITGNFIDTALFNGGILFSQPSFTSPFTSAAVVKLSLPNSPAIYFNGANNQAGFSFQLDKAQPVPGTTGTIDTIAFTLQKQL